MENIGIIGKARSGKDTAAAHLVQRYAYTRLAFADPLKEMALRVDPWITYSNMSGDDAVRLAMLVEHVGWERAKDNYPEVRRLLQQIGQAQRELEEDYWLRLLLRKVAGAAKLNMPVVVTDVRYLNEARVLRRQGFKLVRIVRPYSAHRTLAEAMQLVAHASETELDDFPADFEISNAGSVADLQRHIGALI